MAIDRETKNWIRNDSDDKAARNGCRFDPSRGLFVVDWFRDYLKFYEGEAYAGKPFILAGPWPDITMRLFSWIRYSEKWDDWVRRFTVASIWIPKKNGKSPWLAGVGLYLLCGDGEEGQKVFFGAVDGEQARQNVGEHVRNMRDQSDAIIDETSLNLTKMSVTHEPTRSILRPLSSDNVRSQRAKEGINGSVLIDETHVVDREFMRRITRAGISRKEPLRVEVSTAGDDPDGYGYEQYQYGKDVEAGKVTDEQFFFVSYEMPQDITEDRLDSDFDKYANAANPMMGTTIDREEIFADFQRSRRRPQDLADFFKYRGNVWQHAKNPWLKEGAWGACKTRFEIADVEHLTCVGGLDMARTRDMASFVAVWSEQLDTEADADDGAKFEKREYWIKPFFWMPADRVAKARHQNALLEWQRDGLLILTEGDTIDEEAIYTFLVGFARHHRLAEIGYDPMFANSITQRLYENEGVERVKFGQSHAHYSEPCDEFEAAIQDKRLHHDGNRLLAWQMRHVQIEVDSQKRKKPVKPEREEWRTIDGVVASIFGVSRAMFSVDSSGPIFSPG